MANYKLPKCWLGKSMSIGNEPPYGRRQITSEDVNLDCQCVKEMQAFFCMQGHLTECHVGMSCEDAECSHYDPGDPFFDEEDL